MDFYMVSTFIYLTYDTSLKHWTTVYLLQMWILIPVCCIYDLCYILATQMVRGISCYILGLLQFRVWCLPLYCNLWSNVQILVIWSHRYILVSRWGPIQRPLGFGMLSNHVPHMCHFKRLVWVILYSTCLCSFHILPKGGIVKIILVLGPKYNFHCLPLPPLLPCQWQPCGEFTNFNFWTFHLLKPLQLPST